MESVNVRQLKNNPSVALRKARKGPVMVMKGDQPEALLLHLDAGILSQGNGLVRPALAASLYKDGTLSLGRAAKVAGMSVSEFITHLSELGIAVIRGDAGDTEQDLDNLEKWIASS